MTDSSQPVIIITKSGHKFAPKLFWDVIAPSSFIIFKAQKGDVAALGDKVFILAKFPDTSDGKPMSQPDPGDLSPKCMPFVELTVENVDGETGAVRDNYMVSASPHISQVESDFKVRFQDQADLYTSTGAYNKPWVFAFTINAGMKSASVLVQSLTVPAACNYNSTKFLNERNAFPPISTIPSGVQIDTVLPAVSSYSTTTAAGNYTSGVGVSHLVKHSMQSAMFAPGIFQAYCAVKYRVHTRRLEWIIQPFHPRNTSLLRSL